MTEIINESEINPPLPPVKNDKMSKLMLCLLFDGIGMLSYAVPVFGEAIDFIWAPISGMLLVLMFKGTVGNYLSKLTLVDSLLSFLEKITFEVSKGLISLLPNCIIYQYKYIHYGSANYASATHLYSAAKHRNIN